MKTLKNLNEVNGFIKQNPLAVLYISAPNCGVCTVMKAKIADITAQFEPVNVGTVSVADAPALASAYHILTAPAVLIFANSKEIWRGARFIDVQTMGQMLTQYVDQYQQFINENE
ncbi:thioredoxin [Neisseria weixii]|uniref:Thioredoxin n=1 Tax=Neisseria weixii TaxID=1853276 RepID=A0A3N4ML71_9NEIS|nr:thioredoxin family protein [Neisseria weixii]RPD83958.1 thioredoxin [Neisseria weixii]RPD84331.1 thioredoxin [Neisseria weixii]